MRYIYIVLVLFFSLSAQAESDFRKVRWGMSPKEVVTAEGKPPIAKTPLGEGREAYSYLDSLGVQEVQLSYIFADNKLVRASYISRAKHTTEDLYLKDFAEFTAGVSAKYGNPTEQKDLWLSNQYRSRPDKWGFAACKGDYVKAASWDLPKLKITALLRGDNFQCSVAIDYASKDMQAVESSARARAESSKF